MPIQNRNLEVGTRLVANYKKQTYVCTVEAEGEETVFVLEDGRRFKSLSSAGSAVMGGIAVNGWRFWSLAPDVADSIGVGDAPPKNSNSIGKKLIYRLLNQKGVAEGVTRYFCNECQKSFVVEGAEAPLSCPEGHGNQAVTGSAS